MAYDPNRITFFAKTDARGQNVPFGIKAIDRTKHMYVIGKTGMGKSTLLENMAVQDIRNGEGLAFIDPHGATAETLLDYIPEERKADVLYFAPFDMEYPVSFNVMEDVGADKRHLVVSGLMSVFEKIWVDAWSARMAYILQNTLMALLEYPDSTLLGVNRVLSDKNYRKKVVDNITDPSVKSFWVDEFAKYNERYMQEAGDAIKNKIGQFTANPLIRNIIGQPKSSFDIRKIMDEKKILIMNLSKGLVGESNANLLGSMLTTRIYLAAMSRADMPQAQMREAPNFYFYVDEFQSFANATFADILSEARKYKLNLTIAHQYIEQMEEEVRNAVFGNVGTIIAFRVGPFDAEVLEQIFQPQFFAVDICNLGFAQIYLTLMIDGIGSQPFSAVTLPPIQHAQVSCKDIIVHESRRRYAKTRAEVEEAIFAWHEQQHETVAGGSQKHDGNREAASRQSRERSGDRPPQRPQEQRNGDRPARNAQTKSGSDRPRATDERTQNGNGRSESDSKNKSLDELRAVLAGLSQKEKERESKQEEKGEQSEVEEPKQRESRAQKPTQQRDVQKQKEKTADAALDLKSALAAALGSQKKAEEQKTETAEVAKDEKLQRPAIQQKPQESNEHIKSQEYQEPKESNEPKEPQDQPPQPRGESPHPLQHRPIRDPFDPKLLERMMRVKTSDKTPFK